MTDPAEIGTRSVRTGRRRVLTAAELGLTVTIGIVGIGYAGHFVAVSDQRISFYDTLPPIDKGMAKLRQLSADGKWFLAFAADEIPRATLLISKIIHSVNGLRAEERDMTLLMSKAQSDYSDVRDQAFADTYLRAIGYRDLATFRQEGFKDLGKDEHQKHMMELHKFDLGVEMIIFGYDDQGAARMFELLNPGRASELTFRRYAIVGSATSLAWGSIAQTPLSLEWAEIAYRLLGAKFVSEGAAIGKPTTAVVIPPNGATPHVFSDSEIDRVRDEWDREQSRPTPKAALEVIMAHSVMNGVLGGR